MEHTELAKKTPLGIEDGIFFQGRDQDNTKATAKAKQKLLAFVDVERKAIFCFSVFL